MATQAPLSPVKDMALVPKDQPDHAAQIIALAADENLDVTKLQALINMREQMQKSQAEAAFNEAFSVMQGEIPVIAATKLGDNGKWNFAPLEDIVQVVRPILQRHGFTLSHRTEWPEKNVVKVIGILSHRLGHSRQSEFVSAADTSGSKNAIQGLGSANAYGRRYTTTDLLGIATRDDNGAATARTAVTDPEGFTDWLDDLELLARTGEPALNGGWKQSPVQFRDHATKHYKGRLTGLRHVAKAVQP